jgi:hypothetical protein
MHLYIYIYIYIYTRNYFFFLPIIDPFLHLADDSDQARQGSGTPWDNKHEAVDSKHSTDTNFHDNIGLT